MLLNTRDWHVLEAIVHTDGCSIAYGVPGNLPTEIKVPPGTGQHTCMDMKL